MEAIERQGSMGRQFECEDQDETREVIRRYLPMREYSMTLFGVDFWADAEVEMDEKRNTTCSKINDFEYCASLINLPVPQFALDSCPPDCSASLQTIIEREICRQAAELPGWKNEHKED